MAKAKKAAAVGNIAGSDTAEIMTVFDEFAETVTQSLTYGSSGRKHVALDQLYIIRDYIDRKNNIQDEKHITDETGVHGLRVYSNKLQYKGKDGNWHDVFVGEGGTCTVSPDIASAEVADDKEVSDLFGV